MTLSFHAFQMLNGLLQLMFVAEEGMCILQCKVPEGRLRTYVMDDYFVDVRYVQRQEQHLEIHAYTAEHPRYAELLCRLPAVTCSRILKENTTPPPLCAN